MRDPRRFLAYDFALLLACSLYLLYLFVEGRDPGPPIRLPVVRHYWEWHEPGEVRFATLTSCFGDIPDRSREEVAPGVFLSRLNLVVRADRDTRWADVHRVLCLAGENGYYRIRLRVWVHAGWIRTWRCSLPAHLSVPESGRAMHLRLEVPRDLSDLPDAVTTLSRELREHEREEDLRVVVDLCADAHAPYGDVVSALEAVLQTGACNIALLVRGEDGALTCAVAKPR